MNCEEYVVERLKNKEEEVKSLKAMITDRDDKISEIQGFLLFICRKINLKKSTDGDFYFDIGSVWAKYDSEDFKYLYNILKEWGYIKEEADVTNTTES